MDRALRFVLVLVLASLVVPAPAWAGVLADNCRVGSQPAATLLFPYFKVELGSPSGTTTLVAIVNRSTSFPLLAHVTMWTDWGIPSGAFDLFLAPGDVQTINLRDLFRTGEAPETGPASLFPDCDETLGGFFADAGLLRAAHTGQSTLGSCWASPRPVPLATGYLTVDAAVRCGGIGTSPADDGYFSGSGRIASTDNFLWGDFTYVTPGQDFAQGNAAVPIVADADRFGDGDYTFYGAFVGFDGSDARTPLSSEWRTRFLEGGAFNGGTRLIVWRDPRDPKPEPVDCGDAPSWVPLGEQAVTAWDEEGNETELTELEIFDLATQEFPVTGPGDLSGPIDQLEVPNEFGWLDLDLDRPDGTPSQAWVLWRGSAEDRYSIAQEGARLNDLCSVSP